MVGGQEGHFSAFNRSLISRVCFDIWLDDSLDEVSIWRQRYTLIFFSLGSTLYFKIQEYLKCLHQWILLVLKQNERKEYFFFKIVYEKFVWSFLTYFAFWSFSDQKWIRFSNCSFLKNKDSKWKKFNSELVSILSDEMDIQFLNHKAFLNSSTETVLIFSPGICDLTCFSRKRKTEDSHL